MAFNDCTNMLDIKNDYGQNICPYSPAASFACPYGSVESASTYCPKYTPQEKIDNPGGYGGAGGKTEVVIRYDESDGLEREDALYHLKQANYHFAKAIELLEKEKNNG